jgi:glycine C-acetyltransferase
MDGDVAPLDKIIPLAHRHDAMVIVDDAHGTGVMGPNGFGTGEHFGVASDIDVLMATFSKALSVNGGFVCASKEIIEYMRFAARPYMFSAAMPPQTIAAIHGALDVLEREPHWLSKLRSNVSYAAKQLNSLRWGFNVATPTAIIILETPRTMDIRHAAYLFHKNRIFVNAVEFPAVPSHKQRFRISVMATHTKEDIDRMVDVVDQVWAAFH